MTAGGAQGLEFGPFPQNIARIKKTTTTFQSVTLADDPDLFWTRKNRLVEGTYEVTAHMVQVSAAALTAVDVVYQWGFSDADPDDVILAMTGGRANITNATPINRAIKVIDWAGDGNTQMNVQFDANDDFISVRFNGVMFIPAPTDVVLRWAPANAAAVNLLASSIVRFALVR